jgi:hypothetical protein
VTVRAVLRAMHLNPILHRPQPPTTLALPTQPRSLLSTNGMNITTNSWSVHFHAGTRRQLTLHSQPDCACLRCATIPETAQVAMIVRNTTIPHVVASRGTPPIQIPSIQPYLQVRFPATLCSNNRTDSRSQLIACSLQRPARSRFFASE